GRVEILELCKQRLRDETVEKPFMRPAAEDFERLFEGVFGLVLEHVDDVGGIEGGCYGGAKVDNRDRVDLGVLFGEASDLAAGLEAGLAAVDADDDAAEDRIADRRPGVVSSGGCVGVHPRPP